MDPNLSPGLCIATKCSIMDPLGPLFYMSAKIFELSLGVRSPCPSTYLISVSWHLTAIVLSVQGRNRRYSRANWLHPLCQEIKIIADVDDLNIPLFGDIAF